MTNSEMWRLRRSAALHAFAVVVFAMLALMGGTAAAAGLLDLAVPAVVTGLAGAVGAALITRAVWRQQDEQYTESDLVDDVAAGAPQRTARLAMAGAAVVALIAGVLLAPTGVERDFVIWVAALLAGALALFALLAGDRPRPARAGRPAGAGHPA
jgi:hypothetical protein